LLPAGLLVFRLQGDRIVPSFLDEPDHPWLRALLDERERFVGRPRGELASRMKEPLPIEAPPRKKALATHVLEQLARHPRRDDIAAQTIRAVLFGAAAGTDAPRAQVVAEVADRLGVTTDDVEAGLFADLPALQPVPALTRPLAPGELASRTNLALARGLLARAERVTIDIDGNALPVVRRAKLRGLIVNVEVAPGGARLEVSGPLSIFHHTRVYGRALADLVPLLSWCVRFRLEAKCRLPEGSGILVLASGDPIFPADEPTRFDSRVEEQFARSMMKAAPEWDVIRDPQPVEAGESLVFPDFALVHREERTRRWLVEIVGFWTPQYLARKLAAYRAANARNLVLCIDEQRRCADGDLPAGVRVVWYRKRVSPEAVLEAIRDAPVVIVQPASAGTDALLEAICDVSSRSPYRNAFLPLVQRKLGRRIAMSELIALCRAGRVALGRPTADLAIRPLVPPRAPIAVTRAAVEKGLLAAIQATRRDAGAPPYHLVREWFDWLTDDGADRLRPIVEAMAREGLVILRSDRGRTTIDLVTRPPAASSGS
jgi:uncharacterized protein